MEPAGPEIAGRCPLCRTGEAKGARGRHPRVLQGVPLTLAGELWKRDVFKALGANYIPPCLSMH
jgi:hypothetical protein